MKKGRPGMSVTVICDPADEDSVVEAILKHTTTIGMRVRDCKRRKAARRTVTLPGGIRVKVSTVRDVIKCKAEAEDIIRIAREHVISFDDAERLAGGKWRK